MLQANRKQRIPRSQVNSKIIFSDGLDEGFVEDRKLHENCMLLLGSPFNTSEIMNSFGKSALKHG